VDLTVVPGKGCPWFSLDSLLTLNTLDALLTLDTLDSLVTLDSLNALVTLWSRLSLDSLVSRNTLFSLNSLLALDSLDTLVALQPRVTLHSRVSLSTLVSLRALVSKQRPEGTLSRGVAYVTAVRVDAVPGLAVIGSYVTYSVSCATVVRTSEVPQRVSTRSTRVSLYARIALSAVSTLRNKDFPLTINKVVNRIAQLTACQGKIKLPV
jgi:hypothetical protein